MTPQTVNRVETQGYKDLHLGRMHLLLKCKTIVFLHLVNLFVVEEMAVCRMYIIMGVASIFSCNPQQGSKLLKLKLLF